jgi:CDGSH-type Zn-finger protein
MQNLSAEGGYKKTDKSKCLCGYSDKYPLCDNKHLRINEGFKKYWNYQVRTNPNHSNIEEVIPGIYIISDFISQDQVKEVMDFLKENKDNTLTIEDTDQNSKMMDNRIIDINDKGLSILDIDFNPIFNNLYSVLPIANIIKYEIGDVFPPHQDTSVYCPIESDWGLVLYINDDYEGGELYYTEKNITYRPKSGDLLIHGATKEFTHGTTPIISGTKYIATSFAFLFPRKHHPSV